ncbi:MAG: hypothetical protein KDC83_12855 [Flavobacteriales bacterium]|nr:hypothetical protein [Flavobacteriales bacterium]
MRLSFLTIGFFVLTCSCFNNFRNTKSSDDCKVASKNLKFDCDSTFRFYEKKWVDEKINQVYDSLNSIDFGKINCEIRFWTSAAQAGVQHDVVILRNFRKGGWKAYSYKGFHGFSSNHKSIKEYFTDTEVLIPKKELNEKINELLCSNILNETYPSEDILNLMGGVLIATSHDATHVVEILSKSCKRSYSFSGSTINYEILKKQPSVINFREIKKLFGEIENWGKT